MQYLKVTIKQKKFHIEGFSGGIKVIRINGPKAKRLSDLTLHSRDLDFADRCLNSINQATDIQRESLWRSAIIFYIKCFSTNVSRSQLSEKAIYKNNPKERTIFNYFKSLRNKYIVHDESSYSQSVPGAILNKGDKSYKIEKVICFSTLLETCTKIDIKRLHVLVKKAQAYVVDQIDSICILLTKELEKVSYNKLLNEVPIKCHVSTRKELNKQRS